MPRNNGIYSPPPGTDGVPQTPISSAAYNAFVADIAADQNNPRPVIAGGTGAADAATARSNLGVPAATTQIIAGNGLTGGGNLSANRTLAVGAGTGITVAASAVSVSFGTSSSTACVGNDARLSDSREWTAGTVSQSEAQAGTATTRRAWTSQRVRQNAAAIAVGVGQTWQDVSGSRSAATSYQNTTGKPIQVAVESSGSGSRLFQVSANNSTWITLQDIGRGSQGWTVNAIVPDGWYYRISATGGAIDYWSELR